MPILNYTSKVPVEKTLTDLHRILAKARAKAVMTIYDDNGMASGITFMVMAGDKDLNFKLPVDVDKVQAVLKTRDEGRARRVAWRILKDWVDAQMALIQVDMASLPQVFLPYAQSYDGTTLFEKMTSNGFLQLSKP